jgi:hypothetical protein
MADPFKQIAGTEQFACHITGEPMRVALLLLDKKEIADIS